MKSFPRYFAPRFASILVIVTGLCAISLAGCASKRMVSSEPSSSPAAALSSPAAVEITPATAKLGKELDSIFTSPGFENSIWGLRVEKLDGTPLYDRNGGKSLLPASNMKVFTTAAGLDLLGPDFTYTTKLEALGEIASDGHLHGDLLITGSGDPSLGSWHLDGEENDSRVLLKQWADKIRAAGIRSIDGGVIGDGRVFTTEYYSEDWTIGDLPYWYAAGSSGLAMEENCFRFISTPGEKVGDKAILTIIPDTKYIKIVNDTKTTAAGTPTDIDIVYRNPQGNTVRFARNIALDKKPFQQRGSVWDGTRYAAFLLRESLEREGIPVTGRARNIRSLKDPSRIDSTPSADGHLLATYVSPPLSRIVALINKPSHNFFADQLQRTLGYKKGQEGSFEGGAKVIRDWLSAIGAPDAARFQMVDGSGLARRDYVEPRQTCAVLRHMYNREDVREAFYDSLPIAGVDGDLRSRMREPPLKGNVHAKTGYIGNVRSLSGYVTDADGAPLVFSFMVNQNLAGLTKADILIDEACGVLAQYSDAGDSAAAQAGRSGK